MKTKLWTLSLLVLLFVVGCGATVEPGASAENETAATTPTGADSALRPASPDDEDAEVDDAADSAAEDEGAVNENDEPEQEAVKPVTVDLSQVTPSAGTSSEPRVMPAPGRPIAIPDALLPFVDTMRDDLAERLNVEKSAARVIHFASVTWSDGSLGCPQPDMVYTMALVNGYQVIFDVNGEQHFYHTDRDKFFTYCDKAERIEGNGVISTDQ